MMKLIITIDTEADIRKNVSEPISLENIKSLSRFQNLCEKYGLLPTYLVTYEVINEPSAADLLCSWQKSGSAEVGTHFHPWTTPPSSSSDDHHSFSTELSDVELHDKFVILHNKISEVLGCRPTSYRSGRWGFDQRQAKLLAEFGYLVDCSITPKIDWRHMGGPDFRKESVYPHKLSSGVLEAPMTILSTGLFKRENNLFLQLFNSMPDGLIKKIVNKIFFRNKWFRLFPKSTREDWLSVIDSAKINSLPYIMFMIHSNELHLGTSKDTMTMKMLEHTYKQLEEMLAHLSTQGLESVTLSGYAQTIIVNTK